MRPKGYLIFHLNLCFSSIEKEDWLEVIEKCYWPLLRIIKEMSIPIGIEVTGWTLKQIDNTDKNWVECFRSLLADKSCELIGSGYCQIIGPLVPHKVNQWNQRLGLQEYERILGVRPTVVLVNEMAYSRSLVEIYQKFEYHGFITDRDNTRLALGIDAKPDTKHPTHARGPQNSFLPVLWSDSMLFQRFQHFAHGDITIADYITDVRKRYEAGEFLLPIYCSDAETFDYRPGRSVQERPIHNEGEWRRIRKLLCRLEDELNIEWISPSEALYFSEKLFEPIHSELTSARYPITVKKQAKYNIARWAVSGRNDLYLNTMCHRIAANLEKTNSEHEGDWRELVELWSSDFRTHITEKRWNEACERLDFLLTSHRLGKSLNSTSVNITASDGLEDAIGNYGCALIGLDDDIFLNITTDKTRLTLNLRRGLSIHSLSFESHDMTPCIGTLQHGHFQSITLGADYYSGGLVIELPEERRRITDLENVKPYFCLEHNGDLVVQSVIETPLGVLIKTIKVSAGTETVAISFDFPNWVKFTGSVRLGIITLLNDFSDQGLQILCKNGGDAYETFLVDDEVRHASPASSLVSSSGGFGATNGEMTIESNEKQIHFAWNPCECAVLPMLQHTPASPTALTRLFFSMSELDETKITASRPTAFTLNISASSMMGDTSH